MILQDPTDAIALCSGDTIDIGERTLPMSMVFRYDTERWNLRAPVAAFFGTDDLETLHEDARWNPHHPGQALPNHAITKNSWEAGRQLRDAVAETAAPLLRSLTFDFLTTLVGPIRSVQPLPMLRVNFHGARAILRFHRDVEYGQSPSTINIWLPVTKVYGSNSLCLESRPGKSDFTPIELDYGQALMFYGTEIWHGTLDNISGGTRISLDFRFSL